jgi:putative ATP-dependent endonuclease of the OLD family
MPLGINLRDHNVDVPILDWGSGTQNRTHILMAILQASRIRKTASPDERITPLVVIEEPESFLHPSAQAEFGRLLRHLSTEFGVQIIVTTHSPYMLNQQEPASNILLCREIKRRKVFATAVVPTSGESWMAPFADHLGISAGEFSSLRPIFSANMSKVLLVEGKINKEYFHFLQTHSLSCETLDPSIEVVAYGGKDVLKNTVLIQFVIRRFDSAFVTYDLDAHSEVRSALSRLGLVEGTDYSPVGVGQAGKDCIQGLLPQRVLSAVIGREPDLVMKLASSERRQAKEALKREFLADFKSRTDYSADELRELSKLVKRINARLSK